MRSWLIGLVLLFAGCATYDGRGLLLGHTGVADVENLMGPPAMRWSEADGGEVLVYPRAPQGFHTFFFRTDAAGVFVSKENVLDTRHFAKVQAGMTGEEVLHVLGPPVPQWTSYFKARDELVWEWRYCDDWSEPARFDVLFDGTSGRVRSTLSSTEQARAPFGLSQRREWCGQ
jgi:hypothetical protein